MDGENEYRERVRRAAQQAVEEVRARTAHAVRERWTSRAVPIAGGAGRHRARDLCLTKTFQKHSFTQRQKNQHVATRVCYYHAETLV